MLLSTLGKALESVVAERIFYTVKTLSLLSTNHFRAQKKCSTEQALILLQEHIFNTWRFKKVLSLISFDVKEVYNKVCKKRLLQRLTARGISSMLIFWINVFCSKCTATIMVNSHTFKQQALLQAELLQELLLSSIPFLFFNVNLVQHRLSKHRESFAFVDDYTVWVTRLFTEANWEDIQAIVNRTVNWEK